MVRKNLTRAAALALLAVAAALLLDPAARAGGDKTSAGKVKATVEASRPGADGKQTVTVNVAIEDGWYIYANPVGDDMFAENKTTLSVKDKKTQIKVEYPAGKKKEDKDLKVTYNIYTDKVTLKATVQRAPGDTGPLQLSLAVNACHLKRGVCLPTGEITLKVP